MQVSSIVYGSFVHSFPRLISFFANALFGACLLALGGAAQGQNSANHAMVPVTKASAPAVIQDGPRWIELTRAQRQILQPLAGSWDALGSVRKSKWIAVANTYPSKSPDEQEKVQSRMAEWAALQPSERARARLNFTETKKLAHPNRAADWEAYQNLTPEEKRVYTSKAVAKPAGAAVPAVPAGRDKLTPVPITRHTLQQEGLSQVAKPKINPKTLLPIAPTPARSVVAPAASAGAPTASPADIPPLVGSINTPRP